MDTNVLLSALLARGVCAELVERLAGRHEPIISAHVEAELTRVLRRKFGATESQVAEAVAVFAGWERVDPRAPTGRTASNRDSADEPILAAAAAAGVDVLVTGDRDLTDLPEADRPVGIMTPRELLDHLNRGAHAPPTQGG